MTFVKYSALASMIFTMALVSSAPAALVGYYNFDDSTATDQTTNGNNGTVGASLTYNSATPLAGGLALQGIGTSGAAGLVSVPNSPSLQGINTELTVSLWINALSSSNGNWFRFMRKGDEVNGNQSWILNRNGSTQDTLIRIDAGAGAFNQNRGGDGDTVLNGAWHHLVYTLDNGSWAEYLDGNPSGSGNYNAGSGLSNIQPMLIAGRGSDNINGLMDDVGVWDTAITSTEADAIYNLAAQLELNYDLGKANTLFTLTEGEFVNFGDGIVWKPKSGLTTPEGDPLVQDGIWQLNLDAQGNGVVGVVPEPATLVTMALGIFFMAGCGLRRGQRRSRR